MEPQSIKKFLVPAVAIAAVIVVVALLLGVGGSPGGSTNAKSTKSTGSITVPSGVDSSDAGMSNSPPPIDSPNWVVQPGGLKIWDVAEGSGEPVGKGAKVLAHYSGWLASDGTEFDSSRKHGGEPIEFSLSAVVKGWTEGLPGMKPGGIRRLYIPWIMAYGSQGKPPSIPAKADLIFEVKLVGFQ